MKDNMPWKFEVILSTFIYSIHFSLPVLARAAPHGSVVEARNYSSWMLDSIIADHYGIGSSGAATSQIELVHLPDQLDSQTSSFVDCGFPRVSSKMLCIR